MESDNEPPDAPQKQAVDNRLKLHLRLVTAGGYTSRVVTLRPGTKVGFSTNFFHETWHLVTGQQGAQLLARLLWGLSFQKQPGTLLLVHGDHLLATPFEGERSDPFLLAPAGLTPLVPSALRALKGRLAHLGPSAKTIRWQTFGMDAALLGRNALVETEARLLRWDKKSELWHQEQMRRVGGFICYSAPPPVLRQQALRVHDLWVRKGPAAHQMDYHFLAQESSKGSAYGDGEVQIFADYTDRVEAAVQARREVVPNPNSPILSETLQEVVSRRRDQIKHRGAGRRRRMARTTPS